MADEPAAPVWRDFLIQNICLDHAGAVIAGVSPVDGDPACAATRDLRPGEALPYHKDDHPSPADRAGAPLGYQRHDSFPVATAAFGTVAEQSFDFGTGGRRFGMFDSGSDGGDIALMTAAGASFAATEDGGAGFQLFVGAGCTGAVDAAALAHSWIIAGPGASGETVARLDDLPRGHQETCPARLNPAFTRWHIAPVGYRAGPGQGTPVTLTTLVSEHYGGADPATADHVERFYFTRELGGTRWERWQNAAHSTGFSPDQVKAAAQRLAASGRCSPAPPPAGAAMVMVDCREWTLIVPPARPGGDPPGFFINALRSRGTAAKWFAVPERQ